MNPLMSGLNGSSSAKSRLFDLYSGDGYVNVFLHIRWWIANFDKLTEFLPREGTIVDLGCGYGIFANYLALSSEKRNVVGVELSERKLKYADKKLSNARFLHGDIVQQSIPPCDAVLFLDVLHHLDSFEEQEKLLKHCAGLLNPNGFIFIKDIDKKPLHKYYFTQMVDNLLYPGDRYYYRGQDEFQALAGRLNMDLERHLVHRGTPYSNIIYILRNKK